LRAQNGRHGEESRREGGSREGQEITIHGRFYCAAMPIWAFALPEGEE
jgi:hypothetical protein